MNKTTDKIINKIKNGQLKPMSKWNFWLRDGSLWAGFGLLVLLAILSLGLLWYFWLDEPWFHGGVGYGLFFGRMPMIFLCLIILGAILALFDFRSTGRGYKYSFIKIGTVLLIVVLIAGWSLNYFGLSQRIDKLFGSSSLYQDREAFMKDVWQKPNSGLIAGEIIQIISNDIFILRDFDGKSWSVDHTKAIWRHELEPNIGLKIKMTGEANGDIFIAEDIRPWMGPGGCGKAIGAGSCNMMK